METIQTIWFDGDRIYMLSGKDKVYSRPLAAFPLLREASASERAAYRIYLRGTAVRWEALDEDIHVSSFLETREPDPSNEVAAIFCRFPQLDVSEVARSVGIDKSLLSKYIHGMQRPSPERMGEIKSVLHALGRELVAV